MRKWAEQIAELLFPGMTILLNGAMGSGKTTLVVCLMKALNGDEASSPTFSIVNEYKYPEGVVYHFDLYRLEHPEELIEIGFEEYLDREAITLVEWPGKGEHYYHEDSTSTITIDVNEEGIREMVWIKGIEL